MLFQYLLQSQNLCFPPTDSKTMSTAERMESVSPDPCIGVYAPSIHLCLRIRTILIESLSCCTNITAHRPLRGPHMWTFLSNECMIIQEHLPVKCPTCPNWANHIPPLLGHWELSKYITIFHAISWSATLEETPPLVDQHKRIVSFPDRLALYALQGALV